MKTKTSLMTFAAIAGLTATASAGNFNINTHLGSFAGGSTDAVKANVDYDGPAGPLPVGVYVIKPRTDGNDWYLPGIFFVESGATLIIEPGTTIYADFSTGALPLDKTDDTYGAIVVARGGQIIAEGTATAPIVITSVEERDGLKVGNPNAGQAPVPGRDGGKWGGIVLLGNAPLISRSSNNGTIIRETRIEGFASNLQDTRVLYGPGANPAKPEESSGVLTYMSLRFGGYEFATGSEINGLTMGAVGRGTRIENIEVVSNTDDAFEWFGGTVNCRNLVAAFCNDDNLDMDLGYQGTVQNVLIVQNNTNLGADNALEFSGVTNSATAGTGTDPLDFTKPVVFNVTAIGNGAVGSTILRTNSGFQGQVHNSVFLNYDRGFRIDDGLTRGLVGVNGLRFGSNTFVTPAFPNVNGSPNDVAELALYDGVAPLANEELGTIADLKFKGAAIPVQNSGTFNPALASDSPLWDHNGAVITKLSDIQDLTTDNQRMDLQELPYRGAFGRNNWAAGWSYLSEKNFFNETPVVASGADVNVMSLVGGNNGSLTAVLDTDGAGPLPAGVLHLTADKTYLLDRILFIESGATLMIDPGTKIYCDFSAGALPNDKTDDTYGAILVARGGKIIAEGDPCNPIVMTSIEERDGLKVGNPNAGQAPVPGRDGGKWGGIVLLGNAPLISRSSNNGTIIRETRIEGFASNLQDTRVLYGPGANPAKPEESSGVMSFVSLRFGGYEFATGSEINGLTMGSVGRGTRIENIEVVSNTDDAFEWFGGTVNCRYLVAAFCNDDNLDMDLGYQGTVQNVLIVQNNTSLGADNALEFSGVTNSATAGTGTDPLDFTKPVVFNVTAIGNGATGSTVLRTNSGFQGQVHNSAFLNYNRGIRIDDALTRGLVGVNGLRFGSSTWVSPVFPNVNGSPNDVAELALYDGVSPLANNEVANFAQLFFVGDALPNQNSNSFEPQLAYASPLWKFNAAILSGAEDIQDLSTDNQRINVNKLPYQGAFGVANWAECWTYLSQEAFFPGDTGIAGDADGDGISDDVENANSALGFNSALDDATTVLGTLKTTAQFDANRLVGRNDVTSAPNAFNLFTLANIQDLSADDILVQKVNTTATLTIPVDSSNDLQNGSFAPAGNAILTIPGVPADKQFYRFRIGTPNP